MESFKISNLTFTYPQCKVPALDRLSLEIQKGQFVNLCGPSGCGKSTLLRHLKPVLAPHGEKHGEVLFEGADINSYDQRAQTAKIGFVMQNPDNQIVTDKVWHELAFGLESLGLKTETIRLRVAEMAAFFGIESWFYKNVSELSGGQKQLLNLASIMVMQPSVIILDEPTSQLDPIAAADFLATVGRINRELGVTIIITEHRLEQVFPMADRVVVMEQGRIISDGTPAKVGEHLKTVKHSMFMAMPTPMRVYAAIDNDLPCPVTIREGHNWLSAISQTIELRELQNIDLPKNGGKPVIEISDVWFRYEKESSDVLRGINLQVHQGTIHAILGSNGVGKSTTLSMIAGLQKPNRGTVNVADMTIGVLPQNPQSLFVKKTVGEDLHEMLSETKLSAAEKAVQVEQVADLCRLEVLLDRHPYDLSGGEQQRAALAKILLLNPEILLLDEPTKGLDAEFKENFAGILHDLAAHGITILMVSHDVEFCASHAHKCSLLFDGNIVSQGTPRSFFAGNSFYTTSASRMTRNLLPGAVTVEDVIYACGGDVDSNKPEPPKHYKYFDKKQIKEPEEKPQKPFWRRFFAMSGAAGLITAIILSAIHYQGLFAFMSGGTEAEGVDNKWIYSCILILYAVALMLITAGFSTEKKELQSSVKLSKRTIWTIGVVLLLIPLTIFFGMYYLGDRRYYFISMLVILEAMLPFVFIFEQRKPQARELVVIAVLCAIAVAGRAAFFMLPQFKPLLAMIIISAVAFGGEAGMLVGVVSGFVSNMYFGQGPVAPWQMFAFGLVGFLAGVLTSKGLLSRSRLSLCVFGGLAAYLVFGGIVNASMVLLYQNQPTAEMFAIAYINAIPFDLIHAASTIIFLWAISRPMLEKLDRIKSKYGLI